MGSTLRRAGKLLAIGVGGFVLLVAGLVAFAALGGRSSNTTRVSSPTPAPLVASIEDRVAEKTVRQYQIAKRSGDPMQTCVQAGLVAAAYLQAEDEPNYKKWQTIEADDCRKAGLR